MANLLRKYVNSPARDTYPGVWSCASEYIKVSIDYQRPLDIYTVADSASLRITIVGVTRLLNLCKRLTVLTVYARL